MKKNKIVVKSIYNFESPDLESKNIKQYQTEFNKNNFFISTLKISSNIINDKLYNL